MRLSVSINPPSQKRMLGRKLASQLGGLILTLRVSK